MFAAKTVDEFKIFASICNISYYNKQEHLFLFYKFKFQNYCWQSTHLNLVCTIYKLMLN